MKRRVGGEKNGRNKNFCPAFCCCISKAVSYRSVSDQWKQPRGRGSGGQAVSGGWYLPALLYPHPCTAFSWSMFPQGWAARASTVFLAPW